MVEFPEQSAVRRFFREAMADARGCQPIEDPELALAEPLVDDGPRGTAGKRAFAAQQPDLAAFMGKFYHRPPGGESWADVILRLRSMLNTINLHYCDRRVLIVCHQVVVLCFRYILEELDEEQILSIDKQAEVLNCGIATYDFDPDAKGLCVPALDLWNYGAPLEVEGAAKTSEPDAMAGTR